MQRDRLIDLRSMPLVPVLPVTPEENSSFTNFTSEVQTDIRKLSDKIKVLKDQSSLEDINKLASSIRSKIQILQRNFTNESQKKIITAILTQFVNQMEKYNNIQNELEQKSRQQLSRTVKIILPNANEDQIVEYSQPGKIQALIKDKILKEETHNTLLLIEEQRRDLEQLEKNISELHALFIDVHTLINSHDDSLQNISLDLQQTKHRVIQSLNRLEDAEKLVKRRRTRWIMTIATVVGIGLVSAAIALAPLAAFA